MRTPRTLTELYAHWATIRAEQDALYARYAADRLVVEAQAAATYASAVAAEDEQAQQRRQRLRAAQGPTVDCEHHRRWTKGRTS